MPLLELKFFFNWRILLKLKMIISPLVDIIDTRQKIQLETNGNEYPFSTRIYLMKKHLQNKLIDLFYFLHLIPMMVTLIISITLILIKMINLKENHLNSKPPVVAPAFHSKQVTNETHAHG